MKKILLISILFSSFIVASTSFAATSGSNWNNNSKGTYSSDAVRSYMDSKGYKTDVNGNYSSSDIKSAQKALGVAEDGMLGSETAKAMESAGGDKSTTKSDTKKTTEEVIVTEDVPGVECTPQGGDTIETRKYSCTVPKGFSAFQLIMAEIIRWFVFVVMLVGVLAIVGLGIAWTWAGGDDAKTKTNLKKWAINIAIGLAILFFFRYILTLIAPWIYQ